mmetsp:Transcript_8277/g.27112  ORF Transcript_8277/g.27112 Transcript_8277/m.27112 type:complete len:231 (-) Transcript_8277:1040-1732(-)
MEVGKAGLVSPAAEGIGGSLLLAREVESLAPLVVVAVLAAAGRGVAVDAAVEAVAVALEAFALDAAAALDRGADGEGVPVLALDEADGGVALVGMFGLVPAVDAGAAVVAEPLVREALAVELEAPRVPAGAGLPRGPRQGRVVVALLERANEGRRGSRCPRRRVLEGFLRRQRRRRRRRRRRAQLLHRKGPVVVLLLLQGVVRLPFSSRLSRRRRRRRPPEGRRCSRCRR